MTDSLGLKSGIIEARKWLWNQGLLSKLSSIILSSYFLGAKTDDLVYQRSRKILNLLLKYGWDIEPKFDNGVIDLIQDKKEEGKAPIYISNHHNILIDPLSIMGFIHKNFGVKVHSVIGDNLHHENPVFSAVTNIAGVVEMPRNGDNSQIDLAYQLMFKYLQKGESIWIAQNAGRSKNGILKTHPAILKKFVSCGRKLGFDSLESLLETYPIIPVSLTYFNSPDEELVAELLLNEYIAQKDGKKYTKTLEEDIEHMKIGTNIFNLHLPSKRPKLVINYGSPITKAISTIDLVRKVDQEIKKGIESDSNYHYKAKNQFALARQEMVQETINFLVEKYGIKPKASSLEFGENSKENIIRYGVLAQRMNVGKRN